MDLEHTLIMSRPLRQRAYAMLVIRGVACAVLVYLGAVGHGWFSESLSVTTQRTTVTESGQVVDNWALKGHCSGCVVKLRVVQ